MIQLQIMRTSHSLWHYARQQWKTWEYGFTLLAASPVDVKKRRRDVINVKRRGYIKRLVWSASHETKVIVRLTKNGTQKQVSAIRSKDTRFLQFDCAKWKAETNVDTGTVGKSGLYLKLSGFWKV